MVIPNVYSDLFQLQPQNNSKDVYVELLMPKNNAQTSARIHVVLDPGLT